MLFSEPKIPQSIRRARCFARRRRVSVLFSEPKIPQCVRSNKKPHPLPEFQCSSASRKFLNSGQHPTEPRSAPFQCSSASRKFLNCSRVRARCSCSRVSVLFSEPKIPQSWCSCSRYSCAFCFSALQRAENSSIPRIPADRYWYYAFQCSSASRKFLNRTTSSTETSLNSAVSVLFSEPKIPQ